MSSRGSRILTCLARVASESPLARRCASASKTSTSLLELGVLGTRGSLVASYALNCSILALVATKSSWRVAFVLEKLLEGLAPLELASSQAPSMFPICYVCDYRGTSGS